MFGLPIYGSANMFCDNKALYKNTITPESVLKKKHHYISYHRFRDEVDDKTIRVDNYITEKNLSDILTNIITAERRRFLIKKFTY